MRDERDPEGKAMGADAEDPKNGGDEREGTDAAESGPAAEFEAGESDEFAEGDEPADEAGEGDDAEAAAAAGGPAIDTSLESRLPGIIESLIFASGAPLPLRKIVDVLNGPTPKEIKASLASLTETWAAHDRGVRLVAVSGGYQFRTAPENAEWVRALLREKPARLGRATLETLAIIAYKQPATRADIEAVRGVDADSAISSLLAKKLIKIAGRKETVGRPLMYATTPEFLEVFGLKDLTELPTLKEIGPVKDGEDEAVTDDIDDGRALAEDSQPGGDQLPTPGGGDDPAGPGEGERAGGDGTGDEGGPAPGQDRG